jgi:dUTP pyrophosphatase
MKIQLIHVNAKRPEIAHDSAGHDFFCIEDYTLPTQVVVACKTGVAIEIPWGHFGLIRDRSSMGSKGIIVTAGVIDPDYRGEVVICLLNLSRTTKYVNAGQKIAQMLIIPFAKDEATVVKELSNTQRGEKGFGSTGC